jgi:hypothetical protein
MAAAGDIRPMPAFRAPMSRTGRWPPRRKTRTPTSASAIARHELIPYLESVQPAIRRPAQAGPRADEDETPEAAALLLRNDRPVG